MRNFLLIMLMISQLFLIAAGVNAVGKITVDPNAPGAVKNVENNLAESDARLAQKITYEAIRKPVSAILSDLSEMTGITLKSGYNSQDWQVRDRKMNIFAKEIPLNELMNSIARVMKFKWSRSGENDEWTYRLYMDRKTLLDAETQRLREEDRFDQKMAKRREKALSDYKRVSNLSEQELEKLREDDPFMYVLAKHGIANSFGNLLREAPAIAETLAQGQELELEMSALSPTAQQELVKTLCGWDKILGNANRQIPEIDQGTIRINRGMADIKSRPEAGFVLGEIGMSNVGDLPIVKTDCNTAKLIGKAIIKAEQEQKPLSQILRSSDDELRQSMATDIKHENKDDTIIEHPDEPDLHEKIKLPKTSVNYIESIESEIAQASNLTVVSDAFERRPSNFSNGIDRSEAELRDVLERFASEFNYTWEKHGSEIEFRDKKWYSKRLAQIPQAWIDKWAETLKKTGTLDISDLSDIALLTKEQFNLNISQDEPFSRLDMSAIFGTREFLKFYAVLTENQRALIFTEMGLNLKELPQALRLQIEKLINSHTLFTENPDAQIVMNGTRKQKNKQFEYSFEVTKTDDMKPMDWQLTTPKYLEFETKKKPATEQNEGNKVQEGNNQKQ